MSYVPSLAESYQRSGKPNRRDATTGVPDNRHVTTDVDADEPESGFTVLDEVMRNLGLVTHWHAMLDHNLRHAFCSLVGSKYAAVVAGGQGTDWLVKNCRAVAKVHREITDAQREAILAALGDCDKANEERAILVHGIKAGVRASDGSMQTIRSRWGRHTPDIRAWLPHEIEHVGGMLAMAGSALFHAVQVAVSPETMVIGDALAWEEHRAREAAKAAGQES
jgi:hypothetical protein